MKKLANVVLGVVTSIGGFVEAGSISTSIQAGADFALQLLWAIPLAALILAVLLEMAGRVAALSGRTYAAAVRDRFGIHFQLALLVTELLIDLCLLAAELGGVAVAISLVTGGAFQWWIVPVAVLAASLLWIGSFAIIEDGVGIVGLITLAFAYAGWRVEPHVEAWKSGLVPTLPSHDIAHYAFLAVTIVGATVSPYLLNFYSSGAVEEEWSGKDLWSNRITSFVGMGFGAVVSMGALVAAALIFHPRGVRVDTFEQAAQLFPPIFGGFGVPLFAAALGVGCFGAAVEMSLNAGYVLAQGFGWSWGANERRRDAARFSVAMLLMLGVATFVALLGFNPMQVTLISVALTVILMPVVVLPLLVLVNDPRYVERHESGPVGNAVLAALIVAGALMAIVVVPLQLIGG